MKTSTLLMGMALMTGTMLNAAEPEVIRGIKITPDQAPAAERYYYRISNMRIQRMNYTNGDIAGYDSETGAADWDDIIGNNQWVKMVPLPLFLPDGYPADWEDGMTAEDIIDFEPEDYKLTPQPFSFPYMGLALVEGNFWTAFSAQPEVMNPHTTYWYFTKGSGASNVRIHNAVVDGTIKRNSDTVLGRAAMGFDTKENNYYVIGLKELFEDAGFEMEMSQADVDAAFALSTTSDLTKHEQGQTGRTACLDANNYITYNYITPRLGEDGQPLLNEETGEPINLRYGFASVNRAWNPLIEENDNSHLQNSGTTFFVTEQPTADALAAIEAYQEVVKAAYREAAVKGAQAAYKDAADQMTGWINVPALWKDQVALRALIDECENWNGTADEVTDLASQEVYIEKAQKAARQKVVEAARLVGSGAVVTLQNTLALRDAEDTDDEDIAEEYQLGNAYLSAGMPGSFNVGGTIEEAEYMGVGAKLVADKNCEWELIPVWNTTDFLLYNAETKTYIRKYTGMLELAGGVDVVGENANNFSWATTENKEEAAPFHFIGCANPEDQRALSENDELKIEDYAISTDIENNVHLVSTIQEPILDEEGNPVKDEEGNDTFNVRNTSIHRSSSTYNYTFVNWMPENGRWYADSNTFHVGVIVEGGINEIEAAAPAKAQGIYDLQGRKVAKAGKGLYIINGAKTVVR